MYLKVTAKSLSLMRAVEFHVLLPCHDGYPDAPKPYPTLFFLPGFSCNAEEITFSLPLRQMSAQYGIAIIVPDGENAFYTDHPERVSCHGRFAGEELPEIACRLFPCLSSRPEDTFIGGISMGGYGAAALALNTAGRFSRLMMFSPCIEPDLLLTDTGADVPGAVPPVLMDTLLGGSTQYRSDPRINPLRAVDSALAEGRSLPDIWMCCGEDDTLVRDECVHFSTFLREHGVSHTFIRGSGAHDYLYWDDHLEEGFRFLAGRI